MISHSSLLVQSAPFLGPLQRNAQSNGTTSMTHASKLGLEPSPEMPARLTRNPTSVSAETDTASERKSALVAIAPALNFGHSRAPRLKMSAPECAGTPERPSRRSGGLNQSGLHTENIGSKTADIRETADGSVWGDGSGRARTTRDGNSRRYPASLAGFITPPAFSDSAVPGAA